MARANYSSVIDVRSPLVVVAMLAAACASEDTSSGSGTTGTHASAAHASSASTGGGGGGTGGAALTCDDQGFCGEPNDPGCQGCALAQGSCTDELMTCQNAPGNACVDLNQCYLDCPEKDTSCQAACRQQYTPGVGPLNALATCVFCVECRVSCAVTPDTCPM